MFHRPKQVHIKMTVTTVTQSYCHYKELALNAALGDSNLKLIRKTQLESLSKGEERARAD